MTVKALIEELKKHHPNKIVWVSCRFETYPSEGVWRPQQEITGVSDNTHPVCMLYAEDHGYILEKSTNEEDTDNPLF